MRERLTTLVNWLKEKDIDLAFIQTKSNVFYLTGFYSDPHERLMGVIVSAEHDPIFVCPKMEKPQVKATGWSGEIIGYSDSENPWQLIEQQWKKMNQLGRTIAIEKEAISFSRVNEIQKIFSDAEFVAVEEKLHSARMIKDEKEISILREAAQLADLGVEIGIQAIAKGKTEMDILALIEYELKRKGIREMSFATMVLTGAKTADPHGNPGLTQIQRGDFVLFDLGVVLDGYCSDITRTVAFQEVSEEQRHIYNTVLGAQKEAISLCKIGTRVGDIDMAARSYITNNGYGEFFPHRIGHGLGIDVHEFPSMSENNDIVLEEGFVFTVEPGIYVPNIGGVRIEDDIAITKNGYESLTKFSKELIIV